MIYLLRHGEIEKDEGDCYTGHLDLKLTDKGIDQAKKWKKNLSRIDFKNIYSSDLSRCHDTAEIIANGKSIIFKKELREISLGKWEGLKRSEVKDKYPDEWGLRGNDMKFAPSGGESFSDLFQRVIPVFKDITENNFDDILIVTHAGVIRTIITYVLGMPLDNLFRIVQDYSALNLIKNFGEQMKLIRMNMILE